METKKKMPGNNVATFEISLMEEFRYNHVARIKGDSFDSGTGEEDE